MRTWFVAGMLMLLPAAPCVAQDVAAGETSFKKCVPCHDVGPTAKIKLGPPLNGIDGRKAGTFPEFPYSEANKESGITWSHDTFVKYIKNPMQEIKGTKMFFAGIKDDQEIENLWAYLKQFKADGSN